jgi:hypothetical protein
MNNSSTPAVPPPSLPELNLDTHGLALQSEVQVMGALNSLLRWLGCRPAATRSLWQRYRGHYLAGGAAAMRTFALAYTELRAAVESGDAEYMREVLAGELQLEL